MALHLMTTSFRSTFIRGRTVARWRQRTSFQNRSLACRAIYASPLGNGSAIIIVFAERYPLIPQENFFRGTPLAEGSRSGACSRLGRHGRRHLERDSGSGEHFGPACASANCNRTRAHTLGHRGQLGVEGNAPAPCRRCRRRDHPTVDACVSGRVGEPKGDARW